MPSDAFRSGPFLFAKPFVEEGPYPLNPPYFKEGEWIELHE
jgi:hypothetical protein